MHITAAVESDELVTCTAAALAAVIGGTLVSSTFQLRNAMSPEGRDKLDEYQRSSTEWWSRLVARLRGQKRD